LDLSIVELLTQCIFSSLHYFSLPLFEVLMNSFTIFFSNHLALEILENWNLICWLSITLSHQLIAHLGWCCKTGVPWLQFPSMSSLQGALPIPSATVHSSNMGNPSLAWNPPSSSYVSVPPPQAQTLAPAMGPGNSITISSISYFIPGQLALYLYPYLNHVKISGAYMGQQMASNMPMQR